MTLLLLAQHSVDTLQMGAAERTINRIMDGPMFGWITFFSFVLAIVVVSRTASTIKTIARERTRREIAAFIAEGSITPEQGERLMKAGRPSGDC